MNLEETLALYAQGQDAWNAWAAEMLAERERLKTAGDWVDSARKSDWNQETQDWHDAAKADFSQRRLKDEVDFLGFEFPGGANFTETKFEGGATFIDVKFMDNALFNKAEFGGSAAFSNAEFEGGADFTDVEFGGYALFIAAEFEGFVLFTRAKFMSHAQFNSAKFKNYTVFEIAKFDGGADFNQVEFGDYLVFSLVTFEGNSTFKWAVFNSDAKFVQSHFKGYTSFQDAEFLKGADFSASRGERAFSLAGTEFHEVPEFEQAHFEEAPRLDNLRIELERMNTASTASSESGPDLAARWRALKRLAIQGHDHTRELKFFRGEIKAERWTEGNFWPSVFSYPYEWFSDFGGSLVRPFVWWVASVPLFAGFYLGEHLDRAFHVFPGIGGSIARIFTFAGTSTLDLSCFAGEGEPWMAAFGLSLRKGLLFFGLDSTGKLSQVYGCLYGIYPEGQSKWGDLPGSFSPVIPPFISFLGGVQMLLSSVLIFLFLLAVRNHFRIK